LIAPAAFVRDRLRRAIEYKISQKPAEAKLQLDILSDHNFLVVYGEGEIGKTQRKFLLRPHFGNVLGRCIALLTSRPPIAFINSEEDLAVFIKDFKERDDYTQALGSTLIF